MQSQLLTTVATVVDGWEFLSCWGVGEVAVVDDCCRRCGWLWCVPLCCCCGSLGACACCVLAVPALAAVCAAAVSVGVGVVGLRCPLSSRPPPASHGVHPSGTLARAASSGQLLCSQPPVQSVDQSGWEFSQWRARHRPVVIHLSHMVLLPDARRMPAITGRHAAFAADFSGSLSAS